MANNLQTGHFDPCGGQAGTNSANNQVAFVQGKLPLAFPVDLDLQAGFDDMDLHDVI